jgi:hypothetical protein
LWLRNPRHYGIHRDLGESTSLRPPQPLPYYSDENSEDEGADSSEDEDEEDEEDPATVQKDDYEVDLDEESLLKTINGYTVDGFVVDDPRSDEEEEEDGESSEVCSSQLFMFLTYKASRRKPPNSLIPKMTTTILKKKTIFIPNSVSKMGN